MTVKVKSRTDLVVPPSVQRRAGIKAGDRLRFQVTAQTIVITAVKAPEYKPSRAELIAIRKGEARIARGDCVTLRELLNDMDHTDRKRGAKAVRKASR